MSTRARPATNPPNAGDYVRMLLDRKLLILGLAAAGLVLALVTRPPTAARTWEATVPVEVRSLTISGTDVSTSVSEVPPAELDAVRSIEVAAAVAEDLGMDDGGVGLLGRLTATTAERAPVIYLTLTGDGPETVDELETYASRYVEIRAAQDEERIATSVATVDERIRVLEERLDTLSRRLETERAQNDGSTSPLTSTQYQAVSDLYRAHVALREEIVLGASLSETRFRVLSSPFSQSLAPIPTGTLRLLLFPLAGALLGVAVTLTLGVLRPRVFGRHQLEELDVPVLATVPQVSMDRKVRRQPLRVLQSSAGGAEAIGILLAELHMANQSDAEPTRIVAVVSPSPGDGKSTIGTNLAAAYHRSGMKTVLFRADAADARARRRRRKGGGKEPSAPLLRRSDPAGFDEVILVPQREGWHHDLIVRAITQLEQHYGMIVIDTPPLLQSADAIILAAEAELAVLVVRDGSTFVDDAISAIELLHRHHVHVVGTVLNGLKENRFLGRDRGRYGASKGRPIDTSNLPPFGLNGHERDTPATDGRRRHVAEPSPER